MIALSPAVQDLLASGASATKIIKTWEKKHGKDRQSHQMIHFNRMLNHCVEHNNVALAAAICNHSDYHSVMGRWEDLYEQGNSAVNIYDGQGELAELPDCPIIDIDDDDDDTMNDHTENTYRDFTHILREMNCITPLEAAVKAGKIVLAKILLPTGYSISIAFKGAATRLIAQILLSEKVNRLVQKARNAKDLIAAWQHIRVNDHMYEYKMYYRRETEEQNAILSVLVLDDNIKVVSEICQHPRFLKLFHFSQYRGQCKYEQSSPMKVAQECGNVKMIRVLLCAGFEPLDVVNGNPFEITGEYYVSEKTQSIVEREASVVDILHVWWKEHEKDHEKAHMEQLNWLLVKGQDRNDRIEYTEAILTHNKFPEKPTHIYKRNSPLRNAVKVKLDEELTVILLQSGYNPGHPFIDCSDFVPKESTFHPHITSNRTHDWYESKRCCTSLMEELLMEEDLDTITKLIVQHKVTLKYPLYLVYAAIMASSSETLDRILDLKLVRMEDLNEKPWWTDKYPAFIINDECIIESLMVLLKHGYNPCVTDKTEGTVLSKLLSWFRGHNIHDWSAMLGLTEQLIDANVDLSKPHRGWTPHEFPLQSFAALMSSPDFPSQQYGRIFHRLAEFSPAEVRNATLTNLVRAMCFSMSCDNAGRLAIPKGQLDLRELCVWNAEREPDDIHVKRLYDQAMTLVQLGASWLEDQVSLINTVVLQNSKTGFLFWYEYPMNRYIQCIQYLTRLFPFVVWHCSRSEITATNSAMCFLDLWGAGDRGAGDLFELFIPMFQIYLDSVKPAMRSRIIIMMIRELKLRVNLSVYKQTVIRRNLLTSKEQTLKEISRVRVIQMLASLGKLHRVSDLGLPVVLEDFLLYRN